MEAAGQWTHRKDPEVTDVVRTVNRRKGQYVVSDDWEFKTEPGIVRDSRSCRVRKGTGQGRGLIEVENLKSSQTYHLLRKKLTFTKREKWGIAETSHEVPWIPHCFL